MRYTALVLALVPCALFGDETPEVGQAEKLFRKLEERLAKAKTIQLKYKAALEPKDAKPGEKDKAPRVEGLLLLQKGNKLRLQMDGRVLPLHEPHNAVVVSDGKTMRAAGLAGPIPLEGGKRRVEKAPANLHSAFVGSLTREGLLLFVMTHVAGGTLAENLRDDLDKKQPSPTGFKMRGREKVGGVLTQAIEFRIKISGGRGEELPVTLWLDAKTALPVKRIVRYEAGGKVVGTLAETYEAFRLDGVIDPGQFRTGEK